MDYRDKPLQWENQTDRQGLISALNKGSIVLGTSDTVLGLLAQATPSGVQALNALKGRQEKPYLLLLNSIDRLSEFVDLSLVSAQAKSIMDHFWPGPLTIIFQAKQSTDPGICSKSGTIAIRIPAHAGLQEVLAKTGPLLPTSANKAGQQVPEALAAVDETIRQNCAALILETVHKATTVPSTIIDCTTAVPRMVRQEQYAAKELAAYGVQP